MLGRFISDISNRKFTLSKAFVFNLDGNSYNNQIGDSRLLLVSSPSAISIFRLLSEISSPSSISFQLLFDHLFAIFDPDQTFKGKMILVSQVQSENNHIQVNDLRDMLIALKDPLRFSSNCLGNAHPGSISSNETSTSLNQTRSMKKNSIVKISGKVYSSKFSHIDGCKYMNEHRLNFHDGDNLFNQYYPISSENTIPKFLLFIDNQ